MTHRPLLLRSRNRKGRSHPPQKPLEPVHLQLLSVLTFDLPACDTQCAVFDQFTITSVQVQPRPGTQAAFLDALLDGQTSISVRRTSECQEKYKMKLFEMNKFRRRSYSINESKQTGLGLSAKPSSLFGRAKCLTVIEQSRWMKLHSRLIAHA